MLKQCFLSFSILLSSELISNVAINHHSNIITSSFPDLGAKDIIKLERGKQFLYGGKFKEALGIFKEIVATNPEDGVALHYLGETYYKLHELDLAKDALKKGTESNNVKNETFYFLGLVHMEKLEFDEAINYFNEYHSKFNEKKLPEYDVEVFISQCNNAKFYKLHPVDVKIENAGTTINSKFDDKAPSVSADGKKLVFSSRRPLTTDAPMDVEGDGKYFEDIYISERDSANAEWHTAHPVPGEVNVVGAHDACTSISADGNQIFIYRNNMKDPESIGGNIFVSKVSNNKWKKPVSLGKPINSSYWEGGACISPDGSTIFFTSERKEGIGHSDIWKVTHKNKKEWNKPENLGTDINTEFDEGGMFLSPDGKTLFFCSNGAGSMGGQDIFKSVFENGKWSKPVNLGYPINTEKDEKSFTISADAQTGYFSSNRDGGNGEYDIYKVDLSKYAVLENNFKAPVNPAGLSILKGVIRDDYEGVGLENADVTAYNEKGEVVSKTVTNERGEYFFTLAGEREYTIKAEKKGYLEKTDKVMLLLGKKGNTFSTEKQFLLKKK
jgi:Tol biopolymer transport system component